MPEPVLSVEDLTVEFRGDSRLGHGGRRDVGFAVGPDECLGIVGESGSGKSVTRAVHPAAACQGDAPGCPRGRIRFGGRDLLTVPEREMRRIRGARDRDDLPGPDVVAEPGADDRRPDHASRCGCTRAWTARLPAGGPSSCSTWSASRMRARRVDEYPHRLSGGMRQRVMIAIAIACRAEAADRRRADDGAGRHHPGADPASC